MAVCRLGDLLLATESVSNNQRILGGLAHGREQDAFAALYRHVVVIFLEAEGPGHATTARVEDRKIQAELFEQRLLGLHAHNRLVVTMSMHHRFAMQLWRLIVRHLLFEKLT